MTSRRIGSIMAGVLLVFTAWGAAFAAAQQGPGEYSQPTKATVQGGRGISGTATLYRQPLISEMLSMDQELNLSQDQVRRLQGLRDGFDKQAIRLRSEIQSSQVDLSDLLAANPPDMKKIEAQEQRIATLQAQFRIARIQALTEARAVLTPEQWEQFQSAVPSAGLARQRGQEPQGYGSYAGYGPYGMGPGMMGGYGYGGRGGYGPGMMGGYGGYGPGMMGGYGYGGRGGYGPGMMGGYGAWGGGV